MGIPGLIKAGEHDDYVPMGTCEICGAPTPPGLSRCEACAASTPAAAQPVDPESAKRQAPARETPVCFCGKCGAGLPPGARWCPKCYSTETVFVGQEPGAGHVVHVGAPRVIGKPTTSSRAPVPAKEVVPPPSVSVGVPPGEGSQERGTRSPLLAKRTTREPIALPMRSRWQRGVGTFGPTGRVVITLLFILPIVGVWLLINGVAGPVWATCFTLGVAGAWVITWWLALPDVWRKDEVEDAPTPPEDAAARTDAPLGRSLHVPLAPPVSFARCGMCGAPRVQEDLPCGRCGAPAPISGGELEL